MKSLYRLTYLVLLAAGFTQVASAQSATADIVGKASEATNINYLSYQSASISNTSQGVKVWSFTIRDGGASATTDGYDLAVESITIGQGPSNTVSSWGSTIRRAALFNGTTLVQDVEVISNTISFNQLPDPTASDGDSITLDLYLSFGTSATDNSQLQFKFTSAISWEDFLPGSYSNFAASDGGGASSSVSGNNNKIIVSPTALAFSSVPAEVSANTEFSATVSAVDANGNVDADATTSVTLYKAEGDGSLTTTSSNLTQTLVSGTYTWSDLMLSAEDTVHLATTNTGGLTNDTTGVIDVMLGIFVEHFNYTSNSNLTSNGWTAFANAGSFPIKTLGSSLAYSGYSSAIGVKALLDNVNSAEDVYYNFPSQSANDVFVSCIVSVNQAATGGSYFLTLAPSSPSAASSLRAAMYVKTTFFGNLSFGVSKWTSGTPTYSDTLYSTGTTYLLAIKYTFNPGSDTNDVVRFYIDPTLDAGGENSPTVTASAVDDTVDAASLGAVTLNQVSGSNSPEIEVDAIRVSTAWANGGLPVQFANFVASPMMSGVFLSWSTKTEVDNAGFEVERRSVNPQSALNTPQWERLAFIPGAGTSTSERSYSYTDGGLAPGRYAYRIKQIDRSGAYTYYREAEVEIGAAPKEFTLNDAYPNPFNPSTTINFTLGASARAELKVYDVLGREIATLFDDMAEAGRVNRVQWNAAGIPSGMYFARLESGGMSAMKKLVLLK